MPEAPAASSLLRLLALLSPAFPVGSFSYSGGLERAVHDGVVETPADLACWLGLLLTSGSLWNDTVLLAEAWRRGRDCGPHDDLSELAEALAGCRERHAETMTQGSAFLQAARNWNGLAVPLPDRAGPDAAAPAYPVAVGVTAGANGLDLGETCLAFLQAAASNAIQAAIRLGVAGQSDAVQVLSSLEAELVSAARQAASSTLDDLGTAAFRADILSMTHETQYSRLFRS